MRRTLVLLLLAFLPLQFSWAAVATYCQHEARSSTGHLGHHPHQHHGAPAAQTDLGADFGSAGEKAVGAVDLDCGHCQGQCAGLPASSSGIASVSSTSLPRGAPQAALGAHAPTRPERPQWARLA